MEMVKASLDGALGELIYLKDLCYRGNWMVFQNLSNQPILTVYFFFNEENTYFQDKIF